MFLDLEGGSESEKKTAKWGKKRSIVLVEPPGGVFGLPGRGSYR